MCNVCCESMQKMKLVKFCHFCGEATCMKCLSGKTRPYPKENQDKERRGNICIQCDKKFLYRDALQETNIKLEFRDHHAEDQEVTLQAKEEFY